jgi:hypothetical protein
MKKLFAAAILGMSLVSGFAQGTIDFRNTGVTFSTAADRFVYLDHIGGIKLVGQNFAAGLFYVPNANGSSDLNTDIERVDAPMATGGTTFFKAPTTSAPGTWLNTGGVNIRTMDGVAVGGKATVQVRVWDTAKFQTFAQAWAAHDYGVSAPWVYTAPAAGSPSSAYYLEGLRAFALVPEPSVIALGVLGGASLLFLRRRK